MEKVFVKLQAKQLSGHIQKPLFITPISAFTPECSEYVAQDYKAANSPHSPVTTTVVTAKSGLFTPHSWTLYREGHHSSSGHAATLEGVNCHLLPMGMGRLTVLPFWEEGQMA